MTLLFNTQATLANFGPALAKTSWSKWKAFKLCPASWLATNVVQWAADAQVVQNDLWSIPGSLIQRVWETWVNDRIYRTLPASQEAWGDWFANATARLYDLVVFPLEAQYPPHMANPRKYFQRGNPGYDKIPAAIAAGLPEPFRRGLKPIFVDAIELQRTYGGRAGLLDRLQQGHVKTLALFAAYQLDFDRVLAEQYLEATLPNGMVVNGGVDFFVNPAPVQATKPVPLDRLDRLREDFIILDGKWRFGASLDPEQLHFYAAMAQYRYRRVAKSTALINWSEGKFSDFYPYMPGYAAKLSTALGRMKAELQTLLPYLEELSRTTPQTELGERFDNLRFVPSKHGCAYCPIKAHCAHAKKHGYGGHAHPAPVMAAEFAQTGEISL